MAAANNLFGFLDFLFQLGMLAFFGGIVLWGSLKATRSYNASRRVSQMKEEALVAAARLRAQKRATGRLA